MQYIDHYGSPLGMILLAADDAGLTGLWFDGRKDFAERLSEMHEGYEEKQTEPLVDAKRWLDIYFAGSEPDFNVPLHFTGTDFQKEVWEILQAIPYGQTVTYGSIAEQIAARRGMKRMAAQAVGGAVGSNKISIIVPCHRVIGAGGNLTGYGGGIDKKIALLQLEKVDMKGLFVPKKGRS